MVEESQTIRVAARLGSMDLTKYGVSASIAATMDKAVQASLTLLLQLSEFLLYFVRLQRDRSSCFRVESQMSTHRTHVGGQAGPAGL